MAVIVRTVTGTVSAGGSITLVFPDAQVGDLIVVGTSVQTGSTVSSVADGSNTYTQILANTTNSVLYMHESILTVGGSLTITVTTSASSTGASQARLYRGGITAFDKTAASNSGSGTAATSTAAATPTSTAQLVVGFGSTTLGSNALTVGTGFKNFVNTVNSIGMGIEDKIVYESSGQTATMTVGGAGGSWACGVMTFTLNPSIVRNNSGLRPHPFSPGLAR